VSPPYACSSPSHANRSTGQRNTTQPGTVLARPVCPHVCDSDSARVPASPPYACSSPSHRDRRVNTAQRHPSSSGICAPSSVHPPRRHGHADHGGSAREAVREAMCSMSDQEHDPAGAGADYTDTYIYHIAPGRKSGRKT